MSRFARILLSLLLMSLGACSKDSFQWDYLEGNWLFTRYQLDYSIDGTARPSTDYNFSVEKNEGVEPGILIVKDGDAYRGTALPLPLNGSATYFRLIVENNHLICTGGKIYAIDDWEVTALTPGTMVLTKDTVRDDYHHPASSGDLQPHHYEGHQVLTLGKVGTP